MLHLSNFIKTIILVVALMFILTLNVSAAQIVVLGPNEEVYSYKEFEAKKGETAFSALQRTQLNIDWLNNSGGTLHGYYVKSINGCGEHNECFGWNFYVEGVYTGENASNEQLVFNNDKIVWAAASLGGKYSYKFPEKYINSDTPSIDDIMSSINIYKSDIENNNSENQTDIKENTEQEIESAGYRPEEDEYKKYIDYKNLGYIGIVVCFILFISYYKLVRKGE